MRSPRLAAFAVAAFLGVAGCGSDPAPQAAPPPAAVPSPLASPTPSPWPSLVEIEVTDLMNKAGCKSAKVIGTQLYSKETGRCMIGSTEVTWAIFDTDKLRDEWITFGKQYGGNYVAGAGWAAAADSRSAAKAVAGKLGGKVV